MGDKAQLASQVRFQLERMSARNAHHEFEHLCRHLARARIASNIVPSTGPVSAGGDQGRDFETFRTYLANSSIADRSFVALATDKVIAFAATLEGSKKVASKIREDVGTIVASGEKVDSIYALCSSDLPVSRRHHLIEWARSTHQVVLVIFDGNAISELLSDEDTFWIAERYLEVPSELYPRPRSKNSYEETLSKWRNVGSWTPNFANFSELRQAARHAVSSAKHDVGFWKGLLNSFLEEGGPLQRHAQYEVSVATLRGEGSLDGCEELIRAYFSTTDRIEVSQVEDAATLLMYCVGAVRHNVTSLSLSELGKVWGALIARSKELLAATTSTNEKCILLEQLGFISLIPTGPQADEPDLDLAVTWWKRLVEQASGAPRFPLRRFAERVNSILDVAKSPEPLNKLLGRLDKLVATRGGDSAAAELARDRAVAHWRRGNLLDALTQAHLAKSRWYAEETLRGSVLTILFASRMYRSLGLSMAGKQYALAAAFLAGSHEGSRGLVSQALIEAAACEFKMGAFVGYLELASVGLEAYAAFSQKATDATLGDEVEHTLQQVALLVALGACLGANPQALIERKIAQFPLKLSDFFPDDFLEDLRRTKRDETDIWQTCQEDLDGPPLSDVGSVRRLGFATLGVLWRFEWRNDADTTSAAEELIAAFQVGLAEVATDPADACFLPTIVAIEVVLEREASKFAVEHVSDVTGRRLLVRAPGRVAADLSESTTRITAAVFQMMWSVSLLSARSQGKLMELLVKGGLIQQIFVARPYRELIARFTPAEAFSRGELEAPFQDRKFAFKTHGELCWREGLGPGYTERGSRAAIAARYERIPRQMPHTLERLRTDRSFLATLSALRAKGWKDWHVLLAVGNVVINYRVHATGVGDDPQSLQAAAAKLSARPELEDDAPVPPDAFSLECLEDMLFTSMGPALRIWDLSLPPGPLRREELQRVLAVRYRYWDDDVEHSDPFSEPSSAQPSPRQPRGKSRPKKSTKRR